MQMAKPLKRKYSLTLRMKVMECTCIVFEVVALPSYITLRVVDSLPIQGQDRTPRTNINLILK